MIIKSKRFILRPCTKRDKNSLIKNINDKAIYKNTSTIPYPYTTKDFYEWFNKNKKLKKQKNKILVNFVIDSEGEIVGGIGIDNIDGYKGEIGCWVGKNYRKRGIATEAVKIMTDYGFEKLRLVRIYARIFEGNKASINTIKKNGYKFEGKMIKAFKKDNQFKNVLMFAKTK